MTYQFINYLIQSWWTDKGRSYTKKGTRKEPTRSWGVELQPRQLFNPNSTKIFFLRIERSMRTTSIRFGWSRCCITKGVPTSFKFSGRKSSGGRIWPAKVESITRTLFSMTITQGASSLFSRPKSSLSSHWGQLYSFTGATTSMGQRRPLNSWERSMCKMATL